MKKMLLFIAAIAILAACSKETPNESPLDKYNGYDQFLKEGEIYKDLIIKGGVAGLVTYSINYNDATFEVKYETDEEWELVRTHMFAGKWKDKPQNRRNDRKRFRFPQKATHDPYVNTYTYAILLDSLPAYDEPGFIVAAHAKLYNTSTGKYRHAWADWDRRFRCSGWGGYSEYYYNLDAEVHTNYYKVDYNGGNLYVYLVDINEEGDPTYNEIFTELNLGTPPGDPDDGVAIDPDGGNIFFIDYDDNKLWVNNLDEEETDSYVVGTLDAGNTITGITFQKDEDGNTGTMYYVNQVADDNGNTDYEIREVTISLNETINQLYFNPTDDVPLLSIENDDFDAIKDIAYEPVGDQNIFLIGDIANEAKLLEYSIGGDMTQQAIVDQNGDPILTTTNPQLAFTSDGDLYMMQGSGDNGGIVSTLGYAEGVTVATEENVIICVDPLNPTCDDTFGFGMTGTISIPQE